MSLHLDCQGIIQSARITPSLPYGCSMTMTGDLTLMYDLMVTTNYIILFDMNRGEAQLQLGGNRLLLCDDPAGSRKWFTPALHARSTINKSCPWLSAESYALRCEDTDGMAVGEWSVNLPGGRAAAGSVACGLEVRADEVILPQVEGCWEEGDCDDVGESQFSEKWSAIWRRMR